MNYSTNIIVTGAGGLIGRELCNLFHKRGLNFIAVYRTKPLEKINWNFQIVNLEDRNCVELTFWQNADIIIHTAARIPGFDKSIDECFFSNQLIDLNISKIILRYNLKRLIFLSSSSIYGICNELITEETQPFPLNKYSEGKVNSENLFLSITSCYSLILRINAPYYYKQKNQTVLSLFITRALSNQDLYYYGSGSRCQDFTYVLDIVDLIFIIIQKNFYPLGQIFNVSGGKPIQMKALAKKVVSLVPNCKSEIISLGKEDSQEYHKANFSIEKVYKYFGWQPKYTLEYGIKEWINNFEL